jgi:hypothetical protein
MIKTHADKEKNEREKREQKIKNLETQLQIRKDYRNTANQFYKDNFKLLDEYIKHITEEYKKGVTGLTLLCSQIGGGKTSKKPRYKEKIERWRFDEIEERYTGSTYKLFTRFLRELFGRIKQTISAYLALCGYDLNVSLTLKMPDRSFLSNGDTREVSVFTEFRDEESYKKGERKIGDKKYTINGNSDFVSCLTQERYIFNNITKDQANYDNENRDFYKYYNCVVTVPVYASNAEGIRTLYGFLCGDILNEKYPGKEIFDENVGNMLFSMGVLIRLFIERVSVLWDEVFTQLPEQVSFFEYVYRQKNIGKESVEEKSEN